MHDYYYFPVSHFCEKAQWALDHHEVAYRAHAWVPGFHVAGVRRLGLRRTYVPILRSPAGTITQGSGRIIDALDAMEPGRALTPADPDLAETARAWERELDVGFGENLRRIAYGTLLDDRARTVPIWTTGVSRAAAFGLTLAWPLMRRGVGRAYRTDPAHVQTALDDVEHLLDRLDAQVAAAPYLVGDAFSRADLTAAALFSAILDPEQRPWRVPVDWPEPLSRLRASYRERPTWAWVEGLYADHRR